MRKLVLLAFGLALSGCASITRGWDENIQINSSPPEATVRLSNGYSCVTPCTLKVSRKDEFTVMMSKPGYVTEQFPVVTKLAGQGVAAGAGNILLGGVIGIGVDVASGAGYDHCPNPISVVLRRTGSNDPPSNPAAMCN